MKKNSLLMTLGTMSIILFTAGQGHAVTFDLKYDNTGNGIIDAGDIVGTGTFSYDGPAVAGDFLLSSLTGVSFDATIEGTNFVGPPFDPANDALIGISVEDLGAGAFALIFTGSSAMSAGSLDIENPVLLTHAPSGMGATGPSLYIIPSLQQQTGDYHATVSAAIPEPATATLGLIGLAGMLVRRRRGA